MAYINAELLLDNLKKQYGEDLGWQGPVNMSDVGMMIEDAPTADVQEVRHGEWVDNGIQDSMLSECSLCGFPCGACTFNFCPNCGAKMDGGNK